MLPYDWVPINEFWTKIEFLGIELASFLDKHKHVFWFCSVNDASAITHYWTVHFNYWFRLNCLVFWTDSNHLFIAEPDYISHNFFMVRWFLSKALAKPSRSACFLLTFVRNFKCGPAASKVKREPNNAGSGFPYFLLYRGWHISGWLQVQSLQVNWSYTKTVTNLVVNCHRYFYKKSKRTFLNIGYFCNKNGDNYFCQGYRSTAAAVDSR